MITSLTFAGIIAQVAFWMLLWAGYTTSTLDWRRIVTFVGLWAGGYLLLPRLAWWTSGFITPWIAVLDIALVFIVNRD